MDKLVLIDGNSLLNRAFYAMGVFTTKDGTPTNGIFGFVKLVLKILEDEKPEYFAVAFDVHAPTFRHKLYQDYKGTRKPMPPELVTQVPILKELLTDMGICIVEKAGYEADDIIGTISRKFDGVHTLIYTGDRDAYQLVNEHVTVCFTKRGVSDLDRMTNENFYEKEGLTPSQIIELKSLMGDSSDNIPGVGGIGPVRARELLAKYGTLAGCYEHIDEVQPSVRQKLTLHEQNAYLSHTLATIDTNVPMELSLDDCRIVLPFSE
ncbi:MAG: DNA polymerase I, partial [Clostridiales bacterium]|nr:DNA polymerase I [Clostridiales bacterium]